MLNPTKLQSKTFSVVENASRYLHDEDPSSSRSIKSSLDQVLRKVKTKLEDIFNSPNVEQEKQSRSTS